MSASRESILVVLRLAFLLAVPAVHAIASRVRRARARYRAALEVRYLLGLRAAYIPTEVPPHPLASLVPWIARGLGFVVGTVLGVWLAGRWG